MPGSGAAVGVDMGEETAAGMGEGKAAGKGESVAEEGVAVAVGDMEELAGLKETTMLSSGTVVLPM